MSRRPLLVAAIAAVFLGAVDLSVIATVLPDIIADLGINTADIDRFIWVVTGYLIAYVAAIPVAGMMGDALGRRPTLLLALALFLIGSILCATAEDLSRLVIGRVIQGAGGGGLLPVTLALGGTLSQNRQRVRTIGRIAAIDMLGWLVGPSYGALVVSLPSIDEAWRWIFWLNVPLALAIMFPIVRWPDMQHSVSLRSRADWVGAALLTAAVATLSLGLTSAGEAGRMTTGLRAFGGTPNPLAEHLPLLLTGAAILLGLFVLRQRSATVPMIPRALLERAGGGASLVSNAAIGTVLMIAVVNVPIVVALAEPSERVGTVSAALLAVFTGSVVAAALLSELVGSRASQHTVVTAGALATTAGMALAYPLLEGGEPLDAIPALLVAGLGIGALLAPLTNAGIAGVRVSMTGVSVGLVLLARLLGMTIGISALTAVGIQRLQVLTSRLDPVVQESGESTASFLARQQAFVVDRAIPLAIQVVQETFLIGALIALVAIVPLRRLPESGRPERRDRGGE